MTNSTMLYDVPDPGNHTAPELLVGYPNKIMGGMFGKEIIFIVMGATFITFLAMRYGARTAFMLSTWAAWITSLGLFGLGSMFGYSLAGSGEIIITSSLVFVALMANYIGGGR